MSSIRPLFVEDIKKRRLSGRHQISSDGKHLIDGVAFGRQRLKVPRNRPAIHISPRKRRRLTYDEDTTDLANEDSEGGDQDEEDQEDDEDDEDYQDDADPLLLTEHGEPEEEESDDPTSVRVIADFEDADIAAKDGGALEEEEDDGDFGSDDSDDEDGMDLDELESTIDANEINALREEMTDIDAFGDEDEALAAVERGQGKRLDLDTLDRITALRATFPSVTAERCENLLSSKKNEKKVYKKLSKSQQPQMTLEDMMAYNTSLHQSPRRPSLDDMSQDSSDDEVDSVTRHFDRHGFPPGSIAAGNAVMHDSRSLNAMKLVNKKFDSEEPGDISSAPTQGNMPLPLDDDVTSSSGSSSDSQSSSSSSSNNDDNDEEEDSDSEDDESSSDDNSESGSDDDSGPEEAPAIAPQSRGDTGQASDASSSASSSSDDEGKPTANETKNKAADADSEASSSDEDSSDDTSSDDSSSDDTSSSESESDSESDRNTHTSKAKASLPNAGHLTKTPSLSTPNGPSASTTTAKEATPVPPGQGKSKTQKRNARRRAAKQANTDLVVDATDSNQPAEPRSKKTSQEDELLARKKELMEQIDQSATQPNGNQDVIQEIEALIGSPAAVPGPSSPASVESPKTTSSQRKTRLDMSAGRRMLFGSLGLKNPKNKQDEDRIRANLMKGVRPLINTRVEQNNSRETGGVNGPATVPEDTDDSYEDWRASINYRGVECCQEDINLSEPPFPFVQRWDPQQQGRLGKGKRKQRNQAQFYQDDGTQNTAKKRKVSRATEQPFDNPYMIEAETSTGNDIELNYDDEPVVKDKDHATAESQITDLDDLPSLPSDLSSLPELRPGDAQVGMVITWTAWLLSSATGWQPRVSNMTGIVTNIKEEDVTIEVLLARRDRNLDRNEKTYDQETGQRIYDRFEAPDSDDDFDDAEDEGYRTLAFSEMGDPRIVQRPLDSIQITEVVVDSQPNLQTNISQDRSESHSGKSITIGRSDSDKRIEGGELMDLDTQGFESVIGSTENGDSSYSASTQPGQRVLDNDRPQAESSLMTTTAGTFGDATPSVNSQGSNNSPSRQLEEMSEAAYAASLHASRQSSHQPLSESQGQNEELTSQDQIENHSEEAGYPTTKVDYPNLDMLSSADSLHSGRQPDHSDVLEGAPAQFLGTEDGSIPSEKQVSSASQDNRDRKSDTATTRPQPPSSPAPSDVSSESSIPSLSQVWPTTSQLEPASGSSKTFLSSQKAQSTSVRDGDKEYEAAMRRLDEASDEEHQDDAPSVPVKTSPSIDGNTQQDQTPTDESTATLRSGSGPFHAKGDIQTFKESVSPPSLPKTRNRRKATSGFTVPTGSQVVSLMTSSPEPEYSQGSAQDGAEDIYGGGSRLRNGRVIRGVSVPARATPKIVNKRRVAASQAPEHKSSVII